MMRNRVRSAGWLVSVLLLASVTGCGGDPAPKADETSTGSPTGSAGGTPTETPDSWFPTDAPLPDGPWIPSLTFTFKVPKGFKGEQELGVTTLRKGDLIITVYDPNGLGDHSTGDAIKTEQKTSFTGKPKVHVQPTTVDGQDVLAFTMTGKYNFFQRVAYGFGVDDTDGETRFVVIGFEGEKDPTAHQDTIESVLASIRWNKKVVG